MILFQLFVFPSVCFFKNKLFFYFYGSQRKTYSSGRFFSGRFLLRARPWWPGSYRKNIFCCSVLIFTFSQKNVLYKVDQFLKHRHVGDANVWTWRYYGFERYLSYFVTISGVLTPDDSVQNRSPQQTVRQECIRQWVRQWPISYLARVAQKVHVDQVNCVFLSFLHL